MKRFNVPRRQVKQAVQQTKPLGRTIKPVYQPYRPAVIAPQYYSRRQYALVPHGANILNQRNSLLPRKINYMYSPNKNIVSFARRNPYYSHQPKLLIAPKRNSMMLSRSNPIYQQRYMYNPNIYYGLYVRNPIMNAQRRGFMYRNQQQHRYPYLARRPIAYSRPMMRSVAPRVYYGKPVRVYSFRSYRPRPYVYARDQSLGSNHLNLNMGTSSHTQSHSILKAPGHTTTDTHVVNKQQTGGRVRGVSPAQKGKQVYQAPRVKFPFISRGSRTRGKVSASAKVNAKASASSGSKSSSSSSSNANKGARTTSSGGWGGGAGAGWGSGQNAWGIGYGGGGGGSNWKIPSGMIGIPGMPGKFPGIPQGFPGMPPGGYPSQGTYIGAGKQSGAKRPSSTLKGKKVSLKPQKGLNENSFKKPHYSGKSKASAPKVAKQFKGLPSRPKSTSSENPTARGKLYRVQFFTSDPLTRPISREWEKMRQTIISDVMKG